MLKFEYRHLYICIGCYTMEQATLHIDMIKLIEWFEPIAVIWQNCRVVKSTSKHRKKHLQKQVLFSTKFALRTSEIASLWNICSTNVKYSLARMWANFISHCDEGAIFHNFRKKIISYSATPNISLNWLSCHFDLQT